MSFSLWCYRCYNFKSIRDVNINYNILRKRSCDSCYIKEKYKDYMAVMEQLVPPEIGRYILRFLTEEKNNVSDWAQFC